MKKVLFIDRDGTIIEEPEDEQVDSFEKLTFLPGAITCLSKIAKETDFELVMVTNRIVLVHRYILMKTSGRFRTRSLKY